MQLTQCNYILNNITATTHNAITQTNNNNTRCQQGARALRQVRRGAGHPQRHGRLQARAAQGAMYTCMCICVYIHVCVYIYIYIYMYIC